MNSNAIANRETVVAVKRGSTMLPLVLLLLLGGPVLFVYSIVTGVKCACQELFTMEGHGEPWRISFLSPEETDLLWAS